MRRICLLSSVLHFIVEFYTTRQWHVSSKVFIKLQCIAYWLVLGFTILFLQS